MHSRKEKSSARAFTGSIFRYKNSVSLKKGVALGTIANLPRNCSGVLTFGPAVEEPAFRKIQSRMALDCFKWDIQVGDTATLFRQPLFIHSTTWQKLQGMAEALAAELMSAEQELLQRPDLYSVLGFSAASQNVLHKMRLSGPTPSAVRTLRFDFHHTTEGWRISEVNSDVPGGYTEASNFTELMAAHFDHAKPAGNPAKQWATAMAEIIGSRKRVVLLSAPGFLEDQQITAFLAGRLNALGVETYLVHHPEQILWKAGSAHVISNGNLIEMGAVVRFYQGEWLMKLPFSAGWQLLFAGGKTPVTNPGTSLLTESKRFPLAWNSLTCSLPTWRALLPECRDLLHNTWQHDDCWVLKEAFSNTGDSVHSREWMSPKEWSAFCRKVGKQPQRWVIQRKFQTVPVSSDTGLVYPCIGVYTINGKAAGIYARAGLQQVVNYSAMDVAILVSES